MVHKTWRSLCFALVNLFIIHYRAISYLNILGQPFSCGTHGQINKADFCRSHWWLKKCHRSIYRSKNHENESGLKNGEIPTERCTAMWRLINVMGKEGCAWSFSLFDGASANAKALNQRLTLSIVDDTHDSWPDRLPCNTTQVNIQEIYSGNLKIMSESQHHSKWTAYIYVRPSRTTSTLLT